MVTDDDNADTEAGLLLLRMAEAWGEARTIQLAVEVGVADHLGDEALSPADLARRTQTDAGATGRLLRALVALGLCRRADPDRYALSDLGWRLRGDHPQSLRSWIRFQAMLNEVYAAAGHSLRTGSPAYPAVFGRSIFEDLRNTPEHAAVFHGAMAEHSRLMGAALAAEYDFGGVRQVVDVGGGDGSLLSALLAAYPNCTGVVFDRPEVAELARKRLAAEGLGDRCVPVGGDFHASVPAGGDVYLLKGILHNWSDEDAVNLLRNCRRAMGPASRLVLLEAVLPPGDAFHPSKFLDLAMLIVYGGRERTLDEHRTLLERAGLRITETGSAARPMRLIEAGPADRTDPPLWTATPPGDNNDGRP